MAETLAPEAVTEETTGGLNMEEPAVRPEEVAHVEPPQAPQAEQTMGSEDWWAMTDDIVDHQSFEPIVCSAAFAAVLPSKSLA